MLVLSLSKDGPGLVDDHQSRRIDALLMASPAPAMALYVGAILLACDERLFLSVTPMRRKKRLIIAVSARTPRSDSNRSQSALSVMSDFSARSASNGAVRGRRARWADTSVRGLSRIVSFSKR